MVNRSTWGRAAFVGLAAAGFAVAACNAVLGISPAELVDASATIDAGGPVAEAGASDVLDSGSTADPFSCATYCDTIMKNCTDTEQEYISNAVCLVMCSHFEPGVPNEQKNDSLACRIFHANAAKTNPKGECSQAGPLGLGTCTKDPCGPFCGLAFDLCGPLNLFPYDGGIPTCRTACTKFKYMPDGGDIVFTTGDTLNCRIYHLESAYEVGNPNAPSTHCPHTAVQSATCN